MRPITVALLAALAMALLASWFFATHERVTREDYVGLRGEARVNDYLAAELLLQQLGIDSDSRAALVPSDWLPDLADTLVTRASANVAVEGERELLLQWVSNGGHLVVLPPSDNSSTGADFLEALSFEMKPLDEVTANTGAKDLADIGDADAIYNVDLDETALRIVPLFPEVLTAQLSDSAGTVVARRRWDDGYVSILASDRYFANGDILYADHARLLADTVAGAIDPGKVWFVYDAAFPSLFTVIWTRAPYLVISLAVALLIWLSSAVPRFGPRAEPPPLERRSIVEHVDAAGRFMWKNRGAKTLADSSADSIRHDAESRHPGIGRLPLERQAQLMAKMTGMPAPEIFTALSEHDELNQREFTHCMQALQRIRTRL